MSTKVYSTAVAKRINAKKAKKKNGSQVKAYNSLMHEIQDTFRQLASTRWQDELFSK